MILKYRIICLILALFHCVLVLYNFELYRSNAFALLEQEKLFPIIYALFTCFPGRPFSAHTLGYSDSLIENCLRPHTFF